MSSPYPSSNTTDRPFLLDVSRLIWRLWKGRLPTGIDRACLAYVDHFGARSLALVQRQELRLAFGPQHSDALFALIRRGPKGFKQGFCALVTKAILQRFRLRSEGMIYINIGHTGLDAPGLPRWIRRKGLRPVFMIHDLIPITHPEFCRAGEAQRHAARMRNALDCAQGFVTNSQDTLDQLSHFAAAEGHVLPARLVALLGIEQTASPVPVDLPAGPYFVTIGTIEARKNHLLILHLWERMVQRLGQAAPALVLIGQRGWEAEEVFAMLDRSPILHDKVIELGRCSDQKMLAYLDGARALLMPSFVEGFGIPVIEALDRGVPVVASDLAVFREIAGEIPLYLDPLDGQAWATAIAEFTDDCPERQRQIAAMPAFSAPSWPAHFASVEAWLERL